MDPDIYYKQGFDLKFQKEQNEHQRKQESRQILEEVVYSFRKIQEKQKPVSPVDIKKSLQYRAQMANLRQSSRS